QILPAVADPRQGGALVHPEYHYRLDAFGNVMQVTDPLGRVTLIGYDTQGRELTRTLPQGQPEAFQYDDAGRGNRPTDFDGQVMGYVYDTQSRLSEQRLYSSVDRANAGQPDVTLTMTYDLMGRLHTVYDPRYGLTTYTYDADGHVATLEEPSGTIHYSYDN